MLPAMVQMPFPFLKPKVGCLFNTCEAQYRIFELMKKKKTNPKILFFSPSETVLREKN